MASRRNSHKHPRHRGTAQTLARMRLRYVCNRGQTWRGLAIVRTTATRIARSSNRCVDGGIFGALSASQYRLSPGLTQRYKGDADIELVESYYWVITLAVSRMRASPLPPQKDRRSSSQRCSPRAHTSMHGRGIQNAPSTARGPPSGSAKAVQRIIRFAGWPPGNLGFPRGPPAEIADWSSDESMFWMWMMGESNCCFGPDRSYLHLCVLGSVWSAMHTRQGGEGIRIEDQGFPNRGCTWVEGRMLCGRVGRPW